MMWAGHVLHKDVQRLTSDLSLAVACYDMLFSVLAVLLVHHPSFVPCQVCLGWLHLHGGSSRRSCPSSGRGPAGLHTAIVVRQGRL